MEASDDTTAVPVTTPIPKAVPNEPAPEETAIALIVAPLVAVIILVIAGYAGIKLTTKLAADVIEEMSDGTNFRIFVMNTLTNVGVVSALILSIVIGMMQVEKPDGLRLASVICRDVYVSVCFLAAGFSVQGVVTCAFGILYYAPLSEGEQKRLFVSHPDTIGFPISCMFVCSLLLILEAIIYVSVVGIPTMAIYTFLAGLICFYNCISGWLLLSRYKSTEVSDELRKQRKSFLQNGTLQGWTEGAYNLAFKSVVSSAHTVQDENVRHQALGAIPHTNSMRASDGFDSNEGITVSAALQSSMSQTTIATCP